MISSGMTICKCAEQIRRAGASNIEAIAVHALSSEQDIAKIKKAGVARVTSCDGVLHSTNAVSLAPLLADALGRET